MPKLNGLRVYTRHKFRGHDVLESWSQPTCIKCHRFLAKHQIRYCARCSPIAKVERQKRMGNEYQRRYRQTEKGKRKLSELQKKWNRLYPEIVKEQRHRYYLNDRENRLAKAREYYLRKKIEKKSLLLANNK